MGVGRSAAVALGFALAIFAATGAAWAETPETEMPAATAPSAAQAGGDQQPSVQPPAETSPDPASAGAELKPVLPPDCATKTGVLGVSRIVEIDTASGPRFGDQYTQSDPKFLEDHEIVLTFDDGPARRYTMPILDALDEQCTKATFFSVGRMALADPTTLQEVIRRGHTIGSHTWSHRKLTALSGDALKHEIEMGFSAVTAAAGVPIAPFFRFPYLAYNKNLLAYMESRGVGTFGIHVDSKDFRTRNPGVVLRNVLAQLDHEKKGIILFHDIQPSTAGALSSLLAELQKRGFKVVHMVPKQHLATLPQFDAIAEKALQAKSVAAANNPMATRAVTWPVTGAPQPGAKTNAAAAPARRATRPAGRQSRRYDWANPSNDPWQLKVFGSTE
jgi:peptidoglycan/xylan/chitin deacetylase (PgdA/CDA1 family)